MCKFLSCLLLEFTTLHILAKYFVNEISPYFHVTYSHGIVCTKIKIKLLWRIIWNAKQKTILHNINISIITRSDNTKSKIRISACMCRPSHARTIELRKLNLNRNCYLNRCELDWMLIYHGNKARNWWLSWAYENELIAAAKIKVAFVKICCFLSRCWKKQSTIFTPYKETDFSLFSV